MKNLTHQEWEQLSRALAVEVICMELADIMVPRIEAEPRAIKSLEQRNQKALDVEYHMGCALIALEGLGYTVQKP